MSESRRLPEGSVVPGLAIAGCLATGVFGLGYAWENRDPVFLIASALAFGILAYTSLKE
jgi:hypothetical protein